jgi:polyribonucleotide nucleotidyltransferase
MDMYNCKIEVDEAENIVYLYGTDAEKVAEAKSLIEDIAVIAKEGDELLARVKEVKDFGLIVEINRAQRAILYG